MNIFFLNLITSEFCLFQAVKFPDFPKDMRLIILVFVGTVFLFEHVSSEIEDKRAVADENSLSDETKAHHHHHHHRIHRGKVHRKRQPV